MLLTSQVGGLDYRRRTVSEDRRRVYGCEAQIFTVSLNGAKIYLHRFKVQLQNSDVPRSTLSTEYALRIPQKTPPWQSSPMR